MKLILNKKTQKLIKLEIYTYLLIFLFKLKIVPNKKIGFTLNSVQTQFYFNTNEAV
jgi:hypothetical protein